MIDTNINNNKNKSIIQWNIDGFRSHKIDFKLLIDNYNPLIVCLQETKFKFDYVPDFSQNNFKSFYSNFNSDTVAKGGVLTLIKNNVDCKQIQLNTKLQAVAVQVFYPIKFTILNLYLPPQDKIQYQDLLNFKSL